MSFHFRCSACRGRNTLARHWKDYKRPRRCKHCRAVDRFYVDKERVARLSCFCQGAYHWVAHRPGSPMCEQNPAYLVNRARRGGAEDHDVAQLLARVMTTQQPSLAGIEEAPVVTRLHIAVVGLLWRPAIVREADDTLVLEVWIVQPGGALPVVAHRGVSAFDPIAVADLRAQEQQLQVACTPVVTRGFGISPAVVDSRECLRIGLVTYLGIVPAEHQERLAA
jgi:hypothetical protein